MVGEQSLPNEWHILVSCQHFRIRVLFNMMLPDCECQVAHPLTGSLSLLQYVFKVCLNLRVRTKCRDASLRMRSMMWLPTCMTRLPTTSGEQERGKPLHALWLIMASMSAERWA